MKFYLATIHFFLILLMAANIFAKQDRKETSVENQLIFYTDQAGFRNFKNDSLTYQEIYISFPNYQLMYITKNGFYLAAYQISITITDTNEAIIAQKDWENYNQVDYAKAAENLTSIEIAGFLIAPGKYVSSISITDLNSQASGFAEFSIQVPAFQQKNIQISEIEFARSIQKSQQINKFVKNNIEILPNPSRVFGIESPFVYFYTEIYNLNHADDETGNFNREFAVIDNRGKVVKSSQKIIQPKSISSLWVEKINILDVVSGKYTLKLKVTDQLTGDVAKRETEFWIHNPFKTISLAQYDDNDLKEFRAQIEYVVASKELDFFDQLNVEGKIRYINDFWRNKTPEFRVEHLKRFYSAQQRFASPTMPGWKSDRGRIYIMYGPPDEIVREPASIDTRAYEIWVYETLENQGRVQFVFSDLGIVGNYRLVHSTLKSGERVEIYNPDWINDIKVAR